MLLNSAFNIFKILILSLCVLNVTCFVYDDDGCRTPDRKVGTCVVVRKCQPLINFLLSSSMPLHPYIRDKLKSYMCGYQGQRIKVCCPKEDIHMPIPAAKKTSFNVDSGFQRNLQLLPKNCGEYINPPMGVDGGDKATLEEHPWMAMLWYNTSAGPVVRCTGTIINNKYILTAAHCITSKDPPIGVRVGEFDVSKMADCNAIYDEQKCAPPVQYLAIEEIISHPDFTLNFSSANGFNDIGLIRVSKIKLSDHIRPICLPMGRMKNGKPVSQEVFATNWEYSDENNSVKGTRRKISIQTNDIFPIEKDECQKKYDTVGLKISDKQICAYDNTCAKGNGGPLQSIVYLDKKIRSIQLGITSFGHNNCGSNGYPKVYTRIIPYVNWILENIRL